jgi:hypothetical protein
LTKVFTLIDNPLPFSEGLLTRPNRFRSQTFCTLLNEPPFTTFRGIKL